MKIVNPLFDKAFKYLMDNEPAARKIISVIIDEEILSLETKPQETIVYIKGTKIPVSRFDFKAVILTKEGERYTALIEVQKSRSPNPVARFRRYMGKNYITEHDYIDQNGQAQKEHLPIIAIYFLGYNIGHGAYDTPGLLVNNVVCNALTKAEIKEKNKFVKLLTHPCYILQVNRLKEERKSRLEKMLSLFDQSYCTDNKYILDINGIDEEFNALADYLYLPTQDAEFVRSLAYEEDYDKELQQKEKALEDSQKREAEERQQKVEAQKREIDSRKREAEERQRKEEAQKREIDSRKREAEERQQKEEAQKREIDSRKREAEERQQKEEAQKLLTKMIAMFLKSGKTVSEIALLLDKTETEVSDIVQK